MKTAVTLLMVAAIAGPAAAVDLQRPPAPIRSDSGLRVLDRELAEALGALDSERALERSGFRIRDGRVQLVATTATPATLASWLEDHGSRWIVVDGLEVQAWVPRQLIPDLAAQAGVGRVGRPLYAVRPEPRLEPGPAVKVGAVVTEGLEPSQADLWHDAGETGSGVRVGVVDLEFGNWQSVVGTELGSSTEFRTFGGAANTGEHGTGCAEIVADMAPDAQLYLALINTSGDLSAALSWLRSMDVDVVTMSVSFFGAGPGDGTGSVDTPIGSFIRDQDVVWLNSAGNHRDSHWQGTTIDEDGDGWIEFEPGEELNLYAQQLESGEKVRVVAQWNDWDVTDQDYGLYLMRLEDDGTTTQAAVADRLQGGNPGHTPVESLSFTVSEPGHYGLAVFRKSVTGVHDLELWDLERSPGLTVPEGSIPAPADLPAILAVAAASTSGSIRSYSSEGPSNGPGGTFTGGFLKPDITGYDGVSTVSYGSGGFFGTSAASPHVAGAAALVRGAYPGWTGDQVKLFLVEHAIDRGDGGPDTRYGAGRLSLGNPPGSSCSFSLSSEAVDIGAGGGGRTVTVTTSDECFWSASSTVPWIHLAPDSRTGTGLVAFQVVSNSGDPREGVIRIAEQDYIVRQSGLTCDLAVNPATLVFPALGGIDELSVVADSGCQWQASTTAGWLSLAPETGSGSATITVTAGVNPSDLDRSAAIDVGGVEVTVDQEGSFSSPSQVLVGGIADAPGANDTRWRSTVTALNPTARPAGATLLYRTAEAEIEREVTVPAGGLVSWRGAAADLFGVAGDSSGAVEVFSSEPLVVNARTFNDAESGTFGQYLPGVSPGAAIHAGETAFVMPLASNGGFRTNIGFIDLSGTGSVATIQIRGGDGAVRGGALQLSIPAGGWAQRNRVLEAAGAAPCDACSAELSVLGDGAVWGYASVVDNGSGDPTTMQPILMATGASTDLIVGGIADTAGAGGTRWRSAIGILNPGDSLADVRVVYRRAGSGPVSTLEPFIEPTINPGSLWFVDFVEAFPFLTEDDTSGAIIVTSDVPVMLVARTYNDAPSGTFGQFLPGLSAADALGAGETGVLAPLVGNADFRTNVGFVNLTNESRIALVTVFGADGVQQGTTVDVIVPGGDWVQQNNIFGAAGVSSCDACSATIETIGGGGGLWAYASVVDNGSGDPTTVPMARVE